MYTYRLYCLSYSNFLKLPITYQIPFLISMTLFGCVGLLCQYYLVSIICLPSPLVELGLTDLPKSGGSKAHTGTTGLNSTLRIKEKELLFVDGRSNFTIPFIDEECDFENSAKLKDKLRNTINLHDNKVKKRTAKCSSYLYSLFKILYRRGNGLFDR